MINFRERLEAIKRKGNLIEQGKPLPKRIVVGIPIERSYGIWQISIDRTVNKQKFFNIPDKEAADKAKACLKDKKSQNEDGFIEFLGWEVRQEGGSK